MLKKLIKNLLLISVFLVFTGFAQAEEPHFRISTTPNKVDLGYVYHPGENDFFSVLSINIESNVLHGPIVASITDLKGFAGGVIKRENISIRTVGDSNFVSLNKPVAISKTTVGSHNIELDFRVNINVKERAGKYKGTLVLTVMPPQ